MNFLKIGLCFAFAAAVAFADEDFIEIDNAAIKSVNLLDLIPNRGKGLIPQEKVQSLIEKFSRVGKDEETMVINEFADELLETLNKYIFSEGLDPVRMTDWVEKFKWDFMWITYRGEISLTNGWLQGLASLGRVKDVTLTSGGPKMVLKMPLTFEKLLFDYQYKAKFMGLGPAGGIDGKISDVKFTIYVDVDIQTLQAELNELKVNSKGRISIKFNGNILTDWLFNIFNTVLMPVFKIIFGGVLKTFVTEGITLVMNLYNDLICNVTGGCLL